MERPSQANDVTIGWALSRAQRRELLTQLEPTYPDVIADHVTLKAHVSETATLPRERIGEIVGRVDDEQGVEAMVVRIDGTTNRPGGGVYHITWSLEGGREAVESNDVIEKFGWASLPEPIPVRLEPLRTRKTGARWVADRLSERGA